MVDRLDRLETTLRDTVRSPPPVMPLRRHADDDYEDCVTIVSRAGPMLTARVKPRFKTSAISGSGWRISALLEVHMRPTELLTLGQARYHRMRELLEYAPFHVYTAARASHLLDLPHATLTAERKGVVLMREERPTFGDALLGMGWLLRTANEGREGVDWHHLSNEEERERCQQVGCAEAPRNFYRLKKILAGRRSSVLIDPKYDFTGQFAWYCGRHTLRGSQGLEDNDENLELVMGPGDASPEEDDESPAATRVLRV
jgi:hypothetical protein